jgi:UDP-galactopyranose mutase
MNFCDESVPFTRITEHKHFTNWEEHPDTIYFKEFSKETGPADIPYYPKRLEADKQILLQYRLEAQSCKGLSFLGRLATYRYMDMHHVIGEALDFAREFVACSRSNQAPPVFPNQEF